MNVFVRMAFQGLREALGGLLVSTVPGKIPAYDAGPRLVGPSLQVPRGAEREGIAGSDVACFTSADPSSPDPSSPEQEKCLMESDFVRRLIIFGLSFLQLSFVTSHSSWALLSPVALDCSSEPQRGPLLDPVLVLGEEYTLLSSFYAPSTVLYVRDINMRKVFFCLFYRWRKWESGKFGDLPKFTPLLRDGAGRKPPFLKPACWPLHFSHLVWTPLEMKILLLLPKEII